MGDEDFMSPSAVRQYEADRSKRMALETELEELQAESERSKRVLDELSEKIRTLRSEVERQRRRKPTSCSACRAVNLQVDAAAQSLIGSAGHVARTLLRDAGADRVELLDTVLRYLDPVKHLDPDLQALYTRAQADLRGQNATYASGVGSGGYPDDPYRGSSRRDDADRTYGYGYGPEDPTFT